MAYHSGLDDASECCDACLLRVQDEYDRLKRLKIKGQWQYDSFRFYL